MKTSNEGTTPLVYGDGFQAELDSPFEGRVADAPRLDAATLSRLLLTTTLGIYLVILLRNAWLSEDAYVTFRSLDNFTQGHGLRWNSADRVQAFSNPLWLFFLAPFQLAFREPYGAALLLSVALSFSTLLITSLRIASTRGAALVVIVVLTSSRAFIDYSTSGLENPLTHFLLAVFFAAFLGGPSEENGVSAKRLSLMSLMVGLVAVNRIDTVLLCAPSLAYSWYRCREKERYRALLPGLFVLLIWETTSLVYFGSLIPNTAYAKLNTGIDKPEIWSQGGVYFVDLLAQDPLSFFVIFLGLATPLTLKLPKLYAPTLGLFSYLVYILSIGGDFMSGRFFSAPLFVACVGLSQIPLLRFNHALISAGMVIALSVFGPHSPLSSGPDVTLKPFGATGVADERSFYYVSSGLLRLVRTAPFPDNHFLAEGRRDKKLAEKTSDKLVTRRINVGFYGYAAGNKVHIIDPLALGDPLLARLPAAFQPSWRVGHYDRVVPQGYELSVRTGQAKLADPKLNEYYKKLRLVTAGPLLSWPRFQAIVGLMAGTYDSLIDQQRYRFADPKVDRVPLEFSKLLLDSAPQGKAPPVLRFSGQSVLVQASTVRHDASFRWHYSSPRSSELYFLLGTRIVGKVSLPQGQAEVRRSEPVTVPEEARRSGFNALYFRGERGPFSHEIYGLTLP